MQSTQKVLILPHLMEFEKCLKKKNQQASDNMCYSKPMFFSFILGSLEHIRRNCVQPETPITGECKAEENALYTSKRCTCTSNLCNSASLLNISLFVPACLLSLLFISWHFHGI